jgi:predicted membrane-bound dolichyl-phosphate-mannose-protein mannosyltransferase
MFELLIFLRQLLFFLLPFVLVLLIEIGYILRLLDLVIRFFPGAGFVSLEIAKVDSTRVLLLCDCDCLYFDVRRQSFDCDVLERLHETVQFEDFGEVEEGVDLLTLEGLHVELEAVELESEDGRS